MSPPGGRKAVAPSVPIRVGPRTTPLTASCGPRESPVSDKSPRQSSSQKSDKTIKEKRAIKKAKTATDGSSTLTTRHGGVS